MIIKVEDKAFYPETQTRDKESGLRKRKWDPKKKRDYSNFEQENEHQRSFSFISFFCIILIDLLYNWGSFCNFRQTCSREMRLK